jgi:hypothetical protein
MLQPLDEDFWEDLLTLIEEGKVIPVVGAGVVTFGDDQNLLYPWLARRLAEKLGIQSESLPMEVDLNAVATSYLLDPLNRGDSNALYRVIFRILRDECPTPGQALLDLASISAFNLFLSTTFDPLLEHALDTVRHNGAKRTMVYAFAPEDRADLPKRRRELPGSNVYHLLGRVSPSPYYVVWEEDALEFILALNKGLPLRLGRDLKAWDAESKEREEPGHGHCLLILGLQFSDWLVRFFLRATRQERLSTIRVHPAYLADGPGDRLPESLVLFFGAVSRDIHVMRQNPVGFCSELARRWKERHPDSGTEGKLALLAVKPEMPRGAIFISYAREDEASVATLVRGLQDHGCIVWYDRERLEAGHHWHNSLEDEVKQRCGLFLSVISRTTESTRESYYHLERNWAAVRAEGIAPDEEFYLPVIVDETPLSPSREPRIFRQIQVTQLAGGAVSPSFGQRAFELQRKAINAT